MTEVDRALSPDFEQIAEQVRAAAQAAGHALIDATTRLELVKQTSAVVESLGAPIPGIEIAPNAIAQNEAEVQQAAYDAAIMAAIAAPVIEGAADTLADIPLEELYRRLGVTEPAAEAEEPQPEQPADTQQPAAENPDGDEAPEDKTVRETPAAERASHARGKKSPAKKSAGSTPGGTETRKGGKQPSSATIHARNETLIALLNANGTITAEDGKSAGVVVRDRRGLLPKDTNNALTKLMASGLVTAVKPHERFIGELHLDVELLEKLIATGEADPAVVASYEAFQERKASGDERLKVEGVGGGHPASADNALEPEKSREVADDGIELRSEGHENDEADDTIEYSGRAAEQVRSEHSAVDSKTPLNPRNKVLHFRITFNGLGYASKISVGKFIDVAPQVKLLIGIAQASDDRYQFDGADESRKKTFALKMLNKGMQPEKCLGEPELEEMIVSAIEEGMLCMNGNGLELTADGMQVIRADKTLNSRR